MLSFTEKEKETLQKLGFTMTQASGFAVLGGNTLRASLFPFDNYDLTLNILKRLSPFVVEKVHNGFEVHGLVTPEASNFLQEQSASITHVGDELGPSGLMPYPIDGRYYVPRHRVADLKNLKFFVRILKQYSLV